MTSTTMAWPSATTSPATADGHPRPDAGGRGALCRGGRDCRRMSRAWLVAKGYATPGFVGSPSPVEAEIDALNLVPDDLRGLDRYEARKRVVERSPPRGWRSPTAQEIRRQGNRGRAPGTGPLRRVQADHAALRRPLEGGDRADADRPVVRRHRKDRGARAGGGADGRTKIIPPSGREDLLSLAGKHRALVHQPPAVVGASDPGVVWSGPCCARFHRR
jgi:hypothetical protein